MLDVNELFTQFSLDRRVNKSHACLYYSLLLIWQQNFFKNPVSICRRSLMTNSKIGSLATYHKCIKELDAFGYIVYKPTYNSNIGTSIHIQSLSSTQTERS